MGGVGDVVRELPPALTAYGWRPTVLTPSYGTLHELGGSRRTGTLPVRFRHATHDVGVYRVRGLRPGVENVVLHHELLVPGEAGVIYHHDDGSAPYAVDADKFAFFCAAAADFVEQMKPAPAALHLHDWHTGMLAVLRHFDPSRKRLAAVPMVFTIHNLSYQGQRPMRGDPSSLAAWYPWLGVDAGLVSEPSDREVFNPMAAAIRLADRVNTVSPTYAGEILDASDPATGFIGGEGLEQALAEAGSGGRLTGILNGCDYAETPPKRPGWQALVLLAKSTVESWQAASPHPAHEIALERLARLPKRRPLHVLTSVGRVVEQKVRLFLEPTLSGSPALEDILADLGRQGVLFLLGSGDADYERRLTHIARANDNVVFLCGYSEALSEALFAGGDLFLMPSSFEPCGISQMLAMRAGQPCVVHGIGGLRDTVEDDVNGFVFEGRTPTEQAENFARRVEDVLAARHENPLYWHAMRDAARDARFDWPTSAGRYTREIYDFDKS